MSNPETVENLLTRGRRNVLRLQALSLVGYLLFGPGLLLLSLAQTDLEQPALWMLRGLGAFLTILLAATIAQTRLRLRSYRAVEEAFQDGRSGEIHAALDVTPFRRVVIPKVRLRLAGGPEALYLFDDRAAAAVMEHFGENKMP